MKNLFYNYVALGEAVMEKMVAVYMVAKKNIAQCGKDSKSCKYDLLTVKQIEQAIEDERIYYLLPHVAFDKQIFIEELRALAEKYQDEPNPMPACVDIRRTIWDKLEVTPECKVDLEDPAVFESDRFVQRMCDERLLKLSVNAFDDIKEFFDEKIAMLDQDARLLLTLKYGLNGKPCMSIREICALFIDRDLFNTMRLEKASLLKLF